MPTYSRPYIVFGSFEEFQIRFTFEHDSAGGVKTIRVLFLEMRPMLRGILADAVTSEPDMQLLASEPPTDSCIADLQPDVLVCGAADAYDTTRPQALLQIVPRARVLMLAHSGRQAVLFEMQLTRLTLHEVSMKGVIDAIRRVPGSGYADEPESPTRRSEQHGSRSPERPVMARQPSASRTVRGRLSWREKP